MINLFYYYILTFHNILLSLILIQLMKNLFSTLYYILSKTLIINNLSLSNSILIYSNLFDLIINNKIHNWILLRLRKLKNCHCFGYFYNFYDIRCFLTSWINDFYKSSSNHIIWINYLIFLILMNLKMNIMYWSI
jgi:hypothetical protein